MVCPIGHIVSVLSGDCTFEKHEIFLSFLLCSPVAEFIGSGQHGSTAFPVVNTGCHRDSGFRAGGRSMGDALPDDGTLARRSRKAGIDLD